MNNIDKEVKMLPPFKRLCMTIGELPSSYLESMTYYESLLWFTKYLKDTVIPAINGNAEAVIELQNKYIELKDYVDNYFENLDVQEEINNKLDDMAESGDLVTIIGTFLGINAVIGFDTKSDLKGAENLADGVITRTIGESTYNDGKGSFYKIRDLVEGDVIDDDELLELTNYPTLVAEKIPDYRMNQVESDIDTINNTTIPAIEEEISSLSDKKWLFVGDSYGDGYTPDGMVTPWEDFVEQYMEIPSNKFLKVTRGGAGFSTTLAVTFNSIISEVPDDNDITDVVICGGYNDMYQSCTETTITNGIIATKELCNNKFPNAKIHIGFIGNTSVTSDKNNIASKIPFYIKACNNNNIHYLNNVEYALHNYYTDFSSDGIHPNESGQKEIASAVTQALLSGSADIQRKPLPLASGLSEFITRLSNNIVTLELQSLYAGNFLNQPVTISCDGTNYVELSNEITNGYIVGNGVNTACGYIHLIVLLSNNTYKDMTAKFQITGNKMRIYPMLINSAGNDYETLTLKGFQIRPFTLVLPSINI